MRKYIVALLSLFFIAVIAYSGFQLWQIKENYAEEAKTHDKVLAYKPDGRELVADPSRATSDPGAEEFVNQSVIELQKKYPDAAGWLTVPNTRIDYPFVWYSDNGYYLRRDIDGKSATAGTLFMDYRCEREFTSRNTIIYGHHMKNGSMFGTLKSFNDRAFFDANRAGTVYLPRATLTLEFFAYMVVDPRTESEIYNIALKESYAAYIEQNARHYRDIGLTEDDRIVTLSTCAYEFDDARMVLVGRIMYPSPE